MQSFILNRYPNLVAKKIYGFILQVFASKIVYKMSLLNFLTCDLTYYVATPRAKLPDLRHDKKLKIIRIPIVFMKQMLFLV